MKARLRNILLSVSVATIGLTLANGQTTNLPSPYEQPAVNNVDKDYIPDKPENLQSSISEIVTPAVKRNFSVRYGIYLTEKDKQSVAINTADAEAYTDFWDRDDAGFVRLYDAANCELNQRILNVSDECPPNMSGRGISYSFRKRKYQHAFFSDLRLHQNTLHLIGLNVVGFLTNLGDDVSLERLSLESAGIKTMAEFQPASEVESVNKQIRTAVNGFKVDDFLYKIALPLRENDTYALRAIAYQGKVVRRFRGFEINVLSRDKRDDVIIVFRVIRRHANGSVSLLWRELQRIDAPKLVFPKKKDKDESSK